MNPGSFRGLLAAVEACLRVPANIPCAGEDEAKLAEGIKRLAAVIRALLDEGIQGNQTAQPIAGQESAKNFW